MVLKKLHQKTARLLRRIQDVVRARCRKSRLVTKETSGQDCLEAGCPHADLSAGDADLSAGNASNVDSASAMDPLQSLETTSDCKNTDKCDGSMDSVVGRIEPNAAAGRSSFLSTADQNQRQASACSPPSGCWEDWDRGGVDDDFADADPLWLSTPPCSSEEDLDIDYEAETTYIYNAGEKTSSTSNTDLTAEASGLVHASKTHARFLAPRMTERDGVGVLLERRNINPPRVPYPLHSEMRGMFAQPFDVPPNEQLDEELPDLYAAPVYEGVIRPFIKYNDDTMEYKYDSDNDPEDDMDVLMVSVPPGYTIFELKDDLRHASPAKKREVYDFVRMSV